MKKYAKKAQQLDVLTVKSIMIETLYITLRTIIIQAQGELNLI